MSGSYRGMSGSNNEGDGLYGGARTLGLLGAGGGGGRVVAPVGGTEGRAVAGACGGGAADTLCDRSRRDALIGERALSSAENVGRVATTD